MQIVELRRHTERDANEDLTTHGLRIAAKARETLEFPYDAYVVSPTQRACRTMEQFGIGEPTVEAGLAPRPRKEFAMYEERHRDLMERGVDAVTAWFAIPECVPLLLAHGRAVIASVLGIAAKLPKDARALAVSHGGTIEPFAVAAIDRPYEELFGDAELEPCEGVKAYIHGGRFVRIDVVRLPSIE